MRATTGGNKDSLGRAQLKASSFGKDTEAFLKHRKVWYEILSTNSNVICIETDMNLSGACKLNHVV